MATVYTLAELSTMIDNLVSKQNGQATQLKEVVSNLQSQLVTLIKEVRTLSAGNGSPTPAELEAEIAVLRKKVDSQSTQIKEVTTSVQSQIIKIAKEAVPATISIGTVETGSPGSSAVVTNAGTFRY